MDSAASEREQERARIEAWWLTLPDVLRAEAISHTDDGWMQTWMRLSLQSAGFDLAYLPSVPNSRGDPTIFHMPTAVRDFLVEQREHRKR